MTRSARRSSRLGRLSILCLVGLIAGCQTAPVPSSSPQASALPTPTVSSGTVTQPSVLAACDPAGLTPCDQRASFLSIPIADTNLALTWSSQWSPRRSDHPDWNADTLGLGGWSIDVLQRYDAASKVLIGGDGSWRVADAVVLPSGGSAVPSYDGSVAYVFDAAGREVKTVDGRLGTTILSFGYDSSGRLASIDGISHGGPAHLTVKRASDGTPMALVGTDGGSTPLSLDSSGRLVEIRDPAGGSTTLAWAAGDLVSSEADPMGATTRFVYDQSGWLSGETDPDSVARQWTGTASPTLDEVKVTTTLGRVSMYRIESVDGGVHRTYIGPDGSTTTETTTSKGARSLVLGDGTKRTIGIATSSAWGLAAPVLTPDVTTRPDGVVATATVAEDLQPVNGLPYTLSGTLTTTLNGAATVRTFDPGTVTVTTADPVGRKSISTYDPNGHLLSFSAPGSAPTTYTYDAQGRMTSQTVGTGSLAQSTRWGYDASKGSITVARPDGKVAMITVDANGRATATAAPDGSTTIVAYDADGRPVQVQPPGGLGFTLGSSAAGRPTGFLPPQVGSDGSIEATTYDGDGQPATIAGLGPRLVKYAYDSAGRVVGTTFELGTASRAYDPATGLLTQTVDPSGVTTVYGYAGSTPDKLTWSGPLNGSVLVSLDLNGRAVTQAIDGGPSLGLSYDRSGELTGVGGLTLTRDPASGLTRGSSVGAVQTSDEYDANEHLVRATTTVAGKVVDEVRYALDSEGRITIVAETGPEGTTTTTAYAYDGSDRLATVAVNGKITETDTYDAAGNRTTVASPSGTMQATYDARDRLVTFGPATDTWSPQGALTQRGDTSGKTAFTFDDFGSLRGVTLADGRAITYLVDAEGRRIGREVAGKLVTGYLYDPAGRVVAETDGTGNVTAQFGYDDLGHVALVQRGGVADRVMTDLNGSPRLVIDAQSGSIVDAIAYDAWGRITHETAPGTIPFGMAGGLADPDTGLVHFGARDYDPTTGRWTSSDPIQFAGGDPNLYQYAGGDPVNQTDPTGLIIPGGVLIAPAIHAIGIYGWYLVLSGQPPWSKPPASQSGPGEFHCSGLACAGPNGVGCINGHCESGPNGFTCVAESCNGPGKTACVGTAGNPCSMGDPHVWTSDRVHVDFQAAGEFLAAASADRTLVIQARQEALFSGTAVAFNTAVAANVDGDRIGVYAKEASFLLVNGKAVTAPDIAEQLPHGGTLERHGGSVAVDWPDGSRLTIFRVANTLNYGFVPSNATGPRMRGLLGNVDGNPANDLTGRDGVVLSTSDPAFETKLYSQFGNSWRISQSQSLFDYQPG